jgi:N utilization substance protein A
MAHMSTLWRNTAWLTGATIGQKMIAFLYFTVIARTIGDAAIGAYALALALTTSIGERQSQIVKAKFDLNTGKTEFFQVKIVVDESTVLMDFPDGESLPEGKMLYNPEHHIMLSDAKFIKKDAVLGEEIVFPLEDKADFGRISAQTAKQVIMQKIREAEKVSVFGEFGKKEGEIVSGTVQNIERGIIFIDMGRATGILPYEEQIPGERFAQGERVKAYLFQVDESPKGVFLKLSRSHPRFLEKLFEAEAPELLSGTVSIKSIAREAGSRSKIAVYASDSHIDPVGSLVGQKGVRVSTVMSELGGEKIDVIEYSDDPKKYIAEALSPARILNIEVNQDDRTAVVSVSEDQQSLAIGKGGQNVRLAAKLTGYKIDISSGQATDDSSDDDSGYTDLKTAMDEVSL